MATVDAGTIVSEVRIALDKLTGDVKSVNTKMDQIVKKTEETATKSKKGFSKFFSFIAKSGVASFLALGAVIAKVGKFLKESEKLARNAQEVYSKFDTVFESIQKSANDTADTFAESFGIAGSTARELLGATGDLLVGMGATEQQALDLSSEVNTLAADLASFSNIEGGTARASAALTKALLGERESAKLLGIVLRETDIQQRLLEKGQKDLTGQALLLAKAQVTLELATEQSQKALGDYERTADSAANVTKRLEESTKEYKEEVGAFIVEGLTPLRARMAEINKLNAQYLKDLRELKGAQQNVADGVDTTADRIKILNDELQSQLDLLEFIETTRSGTDELVIASVDRQIEEQNAIIQGVRDKIALEERLEGIRARGIQAQAENDAIAAALAKKEEERVKAQIADTEFRIKVEEDLRNALFAIDQQQQLAIDTGEEFNIELEKQKAVQTALNELFDKQFRLTGPGVQGIIDRYGEWLEVSEDINDSTIKFFEDYSTASGEWLNQRQAIQDAQKFMLDEEKASIEEIIALYSGPLTGAVNSFSSLFQVGNDNEIQAIDAKIAALKKEGESTEELEEKKRALILENFRINKASQFLNATINTAAAIAQALPNIPLSIIAGLAGAAQIAVIAATQPPQLQTGGIVLPQPGGQLVNVAENGHPELALNSGPEGQNLLGQFAEQISSKMGGAGMTLVIQAGSEVIFQKRIDSWYKNNEVLVDVSTVLAGVQ